jgi:hypothetical protein
VLGSAEVVAFGPCLRAIGDNPAALHVLLGWVGVLGTVLGLYVEQVALVSFLTEITVSFVMTSELEPIHLEEAEEETSEEEEVHEEDREEELLHDPYEDD